jgi:hypothetical protein
VRVIRTQLPEVCFLKMTLLNSLVKSCHKSSQVDRWCQYLVVNFFDIFGVMGDLKCAERERRPKQA